MNYKLTQQGKKNCKKERKGTCNTNLPIQSKYITTCLSSMYYHNFISLRISYYELCITTIGGPCEGCQNVAK